VTPTRTAEMTSTGFVAYAIEVARSTETWKDAENAFCGPARWESVPEAETAFQVTDEQAALTQR